MNFGISRKELFLVGKGGICNYIWSEKILLVFVWLLFCYLY